MRVRPPENPIPSEEPSPGYFAPPPGLVTGNEWRLIKPLRDAAKTRNATTILTNAVVAQCQHHLTPSAQNLGMALADLAVTGRVAYGDFASTNPQSGGPIEAAALARIGTLGICGVTPSLIQTATSEVLDRAYQVAWFLRTEASRGDLGWIAVSGEDDLPHRPVNVPRTALPQHDLFFTVPGDTAAIAVQTRYAIATATDPVPTAGRVGKRTLPPMIDPVLPPGDKIILFIHGSDSRLEEANDLIPKLVRTPDGQPSGYCVISMDLPGSGYVNQIDHTEVGPWTALTIPAHWPIPAVGIGSVTISLLPFLEKFIVSFVKALSTRLGQPGLVESRLATVIGGSLGGNLALRLARRPEKWLANAVAYSPGSVWHAAGPVVLPSTPLDPAEVPESQALQAGVVLAIPSVGEPEVPSSRDKFFAGAFDQKIPAKTQPEQWYWDGWPRKSEYIANARLDRREIYTWQYRRWHWRVSLEELLWSWRDPAVQDFKARILLGAGAFDDIVPARIFTNTRKLADQLQGANGDTFFFHDTGHSIHAERPEALAEKILGFLGSEPWWNWLNMGKPATANIVGSLGGFSVMDTPTSAQRAHLFVEGGDGKVWCRWSDGMNWKWDSMGKPPTANLRGLLGSVTVRDTPSSAQRGHVFVEGDDSQLWCLWSDTKNWNWLPMGKPATAKIVGSLGAVAVMDTPTSAQRAHLFVKCDDGGVWCRWSDGATWHWRDMGKPPTANIRGLLGSVSVRDSATSPDRPHVFVEGDDFNLWCLWSDGWNWQWLNMGKPAAANIVGSLGAVAVSDAPGCPQRAHLFVKGDDGKVWCRWSDGMKWHWLSMGKPPTANVRGLLGSVTVRDTPTSPDRPHVFVEGDDFNLWCLWSDGAAWQWLNLGKPPKANIAGSLGAVAVMDTPASAQRAHLFVQGNDGNLWVDWWG